MPRYANRSRFGLRRRQDPTSVIINNQSDPEVQQHMSPERDQGRPAHKRINVRYVVKYPMLGDLPGGDWLQIVGDAALKAEMITGYRLLYVGMSAFGLQNVLFLMDANVVVGDYDHIANDGWLIASNMVGEQDVQILGIELT